MKISTYKKHNYDYWFGKRVVLLKEIKTNHGAIFGKGTVMTIIGKHGGFDLRKTIICEKCGCGHKHWIRCVNPESVEIFDGRQSCDQEPICIHLTQELGVGSYCEYLKTTINKDSYSSNINPHERCDILT